MNREFLKSSLRDFTKSPNRDRNDNRRFGDLFIKLEATWYAWTGWGGVGSPPEWSHEVGFLSREIKTTYTNAAGESIFKQFDLHVIKGTGEITPTVRSGASDQEISDFRAGFGALLNNSIVTVQDKRTSTSNYQNGTVVDVDRYYNNWNLPDFMSDCDDAFNATEYATPIAGFTAAFTSVGFDASWSVTRVITYGTAFPQKPTSTGNTINLTLGFAARTAIGGRFMTRRDADWPLTVRTLLQSLAAGEPPEQITDYPGSGSVRIELPLPPVANPILPVTGRQGYGWRLSEIP